MKQISTGAGLVALSCGLVAAAFVATNRGGSPAFAQGTGGERRIVSAGVLYSAAGIGGVYGCSSCLSGYFQSPLVLYRIWSDNVVDIRVAGQVNGFNFLPANEGNSNMSTWTSIDNGTSGFRPITDVDMSGETDAGDISQVLMDFNTRSEDLPPPPIDCNINAPR